MEWLTVKQVAELMDVGEETVRVWLRTGELPGWRLSRKSGWKIAASDVEAFRQKRSGAQIAKIAA